ncbi:hypothetical protein N9R86_01660 [Alphaproteobacteria bacterium]|nr:hypothetical protein [Alphaproteobacteria bacterium]
MAPYKKKKIVPSKNKKTSLVKKSSLRKNFLADRLKRFLILVSKAPFLLINLIIFNVMKFIKQVFLHLFNIIKNILELFANFKDALFGIIFGFLSGSIGAVVILSYLDINTNPNDNLNNETINKNSQKITTLEDSNKSLELALRNTNLIESKISNISKTIDELSLKNKENTLKVSENNQEIKKLFNQSELNTNQIKNVILDVKNTSELILSSSKTELSNRLYLAQSLVERLKSGVPYSPQLVALGKAGLHPALLRFAKGGAPTNMDLTARLSARAGELRDSYRTKADQTWKDNLKDEISKYVKVKQTNSKNIKGMNGVLLRAEEAISKDDLKTAILEISSLELTERGVLLDAWLNEAIAKKEATIAAENLLARTTAALKKRN